MPRVIRLPDGGDAWLVEGRPLREVPYDLYGGKGRDRWRPIGQSYETTAGTGPRSLEQYVADLKPNQTEIYYLVGDSAERLRSNPKLEATRARGIEVLLLTDPVDALWTSMPRDYKGKPLKSLSQGEVDLNLVMTGSGQFIEVQGTGEEATFSRSQLDRLLKLGKVGIDAITATQKKALGAGWPLTV